MKEKKFRKLSDLFIVEGEKFVREIPDDWHVDKIIVSEKFAKSGVNIYNKNHYFDFVLPDWLFDYISDTDSPQGIMLVCQKKNYKLGDLDFSKNLFLVAAENLSNPGNLGVLIRNCAAFDVDGLLLSKNSVDLCNPKVLRACAGNIFKIKVIENLDFNSELKKIKELGFKIFSTSSDALKECSETNFKGKSLIVFGNEATGVSRYVRNLCDESVSISMTNGVESLNISVASGIFLYETFLQRR